jgi:membrane protease YdiL (CAAX protease family)
MQTKPNPRREVAAMVFAVVFPSVITWIYFVSLRGAPAAAQQGAYGIGKLIQFGFPVVWVAIIAREPIFQWRRPPISGISIGIVSGLCAFAAALGLYVLVFKPWGAFDVAQGIAQAKVSGMAIDSIWKYCALGIFYSVFHSGMEEYYWRWFVHGRLRRLIGVPASTGISSIGFMAHHVIVLALYFGITSPLTYFFSVAVAVGGAFWAWLYERSGTISTSWISHAIVDVVIFAIGFDIVREVLV